MINQALLVSKLEQTNIYFHDPGFPIHHNVFNLTFVESFAEPSKAAELDAWIHEVKLLYREYVEKREQRESESAQLYEKLPLLLLRCAYFEYRFGRYLDAIKIADWAIKEKERFEKDSKSIEFGYYYIVKGKILGRLQEHRETIELYEQVKAMLDQPDPEKKEIAALVCAIAESCLGALYVDIDKLDAAHEELTNALERKLEIEGLPKKHPEIAFTMHCLGNLACRKEDYDGAREFYKESLAMIGEVRKSNRVTAKSYEKIAKYREAILAYKESNYASAIKRIKAFLDGLNEDRHESDVALHTRTVRAERYLIHAYFNEGEMKEAEERLPKTLDKMGYLVQNVGKSPRGFRNIRFDLVKQIANPDNLYIRQHAPDLVEFFYLLGKIQHRKACFTLAQCHYSYAIHIFHYIAESAAFQIDLQDSAQRTSQVGKQYDLEKILSLGCRYLRILHFDFSELLYRYGLALYKQGYIDKALVLYEEVLLINTLLIDKKPTRIAAEALIKFQVHKRIGLIEVIREIGNAYFRLNKVGRALTIYTKIDLVYKAFRSIKADEENSLVMMKNYYCLARLYLSIGDINEAEEYINIIFKRYSEDDCFNQISEKNFDWLCFLVIKTRLLYESGNLAKAKRKIEWVLKNPLIQQQAVEKIHHPYVFYLKILKARIYSEQGYYAKSERVLNDVEIFHYPDQGEMIDFEMRQILSLRAINASRIYCFSKREGRSEDTDLALRKAIIACRSKAEKFSDLIFYFIYLKYDIKKLEFSWFTESDHQVLSVDFEMLYKRLQKLVNSAEELLGVMKQETKGEVKFRRYHQVVAEMYLMLSNLSYTLYMQIDKKQNRDNACKFYKKALSLISEEVKFVKNEKEIIFLLSRLLRGVKAFWPFNANDCIIPDRDKLVAGLKANELQSFHLSLAMLLSRDEIYASNIAITPDENIFLVEAWQLTLLLNQEIKGSSSKKSHRNFQRTHDMIGGFTQNIEKYKNTIDAVYIRKSIQYNEEEKSLYLLRSRFIELLLLEKERPEHIKKRRTWTRKGKRKLIKETDDRRDLRVSYDTKMKFRSEKIEDFEELEVSDEYIELQRFLRKKLEIFESLRPFETKNKNTSSTPTRQNSNSKTLQKEEESRASSELIATEIFFRKEDVDAIFETLRETGACLLTGGYGAGKFPVIGALRDKCKAESNRLFLGGSKILFSSADTFFQFTQELFSDKDINVKIKSQSNEHHLNDKRKLGKIIRNYFLERSEESNFVLFFSNVREGELLQFVQNNFISHSIPNVKVLISYHDWHDQNANVFSAIEKLDEKKIYTFPLRNADYDKAFRGEVESWLQEKKMIEAREKGGVAKKKLEKWKVGGSIKRVPSQPQNLEVVASEIAGLCKYYPIIFLLFKNIMEEQPFSEKSNFKKDLKTALDSKQKEALGEFNHQFYISIQNMVAYFLGARTDGWSKNRYQFKDTKISIIGAFYVSLSFMKKSVFPEKFLKEFFIQFMDKESSFPMKKDKEFKNMISQGFLLKNLQNQKVCFELHPLFQYVFDDYVAIKSAEWHEKIYLKVVGIFNEMLYFSRFDPRAVVDKHEAMVHAVSFLFTQFSAKKTKSEIDFSSKQVLDLFELTLTHNIYTLRHSARIKDFHKLLSGQIERLKSPAITGLLSYFFFLQEEYTQSFEYLAVTRKLIDGNTSLTPETEGLCDFVEARLAIEAEGDYQKADKLLLILEQQGNKLALQEEYKKGIAKLVNPANVLVEQANCSFKRKNYDAAEEKFLRAEELFKQAKKKIEERDVFSSSRIRHLELLQKIVYCFIRKADYKRANQYHKKLNDEFEILSKYLSKEYKQLCEVENKLLKIELSYKNIFSSGIRSSLITFRQLVDDLNKVLNELGENTKNLLKIRAYFLKARICCCLGDYHNSSISYEKLWEMITSSDFNFPGIASNIYHDLGTTAQDLSWRNYLICFSYYDLNLKDNKHKNEEVAPENESPENKLREKITRNFPQMEESSLFNEIIDLFEAAKKRFKGLSYEQICKKVGSIQKLCIVEKVDELLRLKINIQLEIILGDAAYCSHKMREKAKEHYEFSITLSKDLEAISKSSQPEIASQKPQLEPKEYTPTSLNIYGVIPRVSSIFSTSVDLKERGKELYEVFSQPYSPYTITGLRGHPVILAVSLLYFINIYSFLKKEPISPKLKSEGMKNILLGLLELKKSLKQFHPHQKKIQTLGVFPHMEILCEGDTIETLLEKVSIEYKEKLTDERHYKVEDLIKYLHVKFINPELPNPAGNYKFSDFLADCRKGSISENTIRFSKSISGKTIDNVLPHEQQLYDLYEDIKDLLIDAIHVYNMQEKFSEFLTETGSGAIENYEKKPEVLLRECNLLESWVKDKQRRESLVFGLQEQAANNFFHAELFSQLITQINKPAENNLPRLHQVAGVLGSGKTHVINHFLSSIGRDNNEEQQQQAVSQLSESQKNWLVCLLTPQTIETLLRTLRARFHFDMELTLKEIFSLVGKERLEKVDRLIVAFVGNFGQEKINSYIPDALSVENGDFIFSSTLFYSQIQTVFMQPVCSAVSRQQLIGARSNVEKFSNQSSLKRLVETIDGYPLAINYMANKIKESPQSIENIRTDYLKQFKSADCFSMQSSELKNVEERYFFQLGIYADNFFQRLNALINLSKLDQQKDKIIKFLTILLFCGTEPLSLTFFERCREKLQLERESFKKIVHIFSVLILLKNEQNELIVVVPRSLRATLLLSKIVQRNRKRDILPKILLFTSIVHELFNYHEEQSYTTEQLAALRTFVPHIQYFDSFLQDLSSVFSDEIVVKERFEQLRFYLVLSLADFLYSHERDRVQAVFYLKSLNRLYLKNSKQFDEVAVRKFYNLFAAVLLELGYSKTASRLPLTGDFSYELKLKSSQGEKEILLQKLKALYLRARSFVYDTQYKQACELFLEGKEMIASITHCFPDDESSAEEIWLLALEARVNIFLGNYQIAQQLNEESLVKRKVLYKNEPQHYCLHTVHFTFALSYFYQGKLPEMKKALDEVKRGMLQQQPIVTTDYFSYLRFLGAYFYEVGNFNQAEKTLIEALNYHQTHFVDKPSGFLYFIYLYMARVTLALRQPNKASEHLNYALTCMQNKFSFSDEPYDLNHPDFTWLYLVTKGDLALQFDNKEDAKNYYRQSVNYLTTSFSTDYALLAIPYLRLMRLALLESDRDAAEYWLDITRQFFSNRPRLRGIPRLFFSSNWEESELSLLMRFHWFHSILTLGEFIMGKKSKDQLKRKGKSKAEQKKLMEKVKKKNSQGHQKSNKSTEWVNWPEKEYQSSFLVHHLALKCLLKGAEYPQLDGTTSHFPSMFSDDGNREKLRVISGLYGTGKSALAYHYAKQVCQNQDGKQPYEIVCWIEYKKEEQAIAKLAEHLKCKSKEKNKEAKEKDKGAKAFKELAAQSYLLIFDGYFSSTELNQVFARYGEILGNNILSKNQHILVTSPTNCWPSNQADTLVLSYLVPKGDWFNSRNAAIRHLETLYDEKFPMKSSVLPDSVIEEIKNICIELEYYPPAALALVNECGVGGTFPTLAKISTLEAVVAPANALFEVFEQSPQFCQNGDNAIFRRCLLLFIMGGWNDLSITGYLTEIADEPDETVENKVKGYIKKLSTLIKNFNLDSSSLPKVLAIALFEKMCKEFDLTELAADLVSLATLLQDNLKQAEALLGQQQDRTAQVPYHAIDFLSNFFSSIQDHIEEKEPILLIQVTLFKLCFSSARYAYRILRERGLAKNYFEKAEKCLNSNDEIGQQIAAHKIAQFYHEMAGNFIELREYQLAYKYSNLGKHWESDEKEAQTFDEKKAKISTCYEEMRRLNMQSKYPDIIQKIGEPELILSLFSKKDPVLPDAIKLLAILGRAEMFLGLYDNAEKTFSQLETVRKQAIGSNSDLDRRMVQHFFNTALLYFLSCDYQKATIELKKIENIVDNEESKDNPLEFSIYMGLYRLQAMLAVEMGNVNAEVLLQKAKDFHEEKYKDKPYFSIWRLFVSEAEFLLHQHKTEAARITIVKAFGLLKKAKKLENSSFIDLTEMNQSRLETDEKGWIDLEVADFFIRVGAVYSAINQSLAKDFYQLALSIYDRYFMQYEGYFADYAQDIPSRLRSEVYWGLINLEDNIEEQCVRWQEYKKEGKLYSATHSVENSCIKLLALCDAREEYFKAIAARLDLKTKLQTFPTNVLFSDSGHHQFDLAVGYLKYYINALFNTLSIYYDVYGIAMFDHYKTTSLIPPLSNVLERLLPSMPAEDSIQTHEFSTMLCDKEIITKPHKSRIRGVVLEISSYLQNELKPNQENLIMLNETVALPTSKVVEDITEQAVTELAGYIDTSNFALTDINDDLTRELAMVAGGQFAEYQSADEFDVALSKFRDESSLNKKAFRDLFNKKLSIALPISPILRAAKEGRYDIYQYLIRNALTGGNKIMVGGKELTASHTAALSGQTDFLLKHMKKERRLQSFTFRVAEQQIPFDELLICIRLNDRAGVTALLELLELKSLSYAYWGSLLHVAVAYNADVTILRDLFFYVKEFSSNSLMEPNYQNFNVLELALSLERFEHADWLLVHMLYHEGVPEGSNLLEKAFLLCASNNWVDSLVYLIDNWQISRFIRPSADYNDMIAKVTEEHKTLKPLINSAVQENYWQTFRKPDPRSQSYTNLVFSGGGMKGSIYPQVAAAFVAACDKRGQQKPMESRRLSATSVKNISGTSAGAIFALMYALDLEQNVLEVEMNRDFSVFLEGKDYLSRIATAEEKGFFANVLMALGALADETKADDAQSWPEKLSRSWSRAKHFYQNVTELLAKCKTFSSEKGLISGDVIKDWLAKLIEKAQLPENASTGLIHEITFGEWGKLVDNNRTEKQYKHLYIATTCLQTGRVEIFNSRDPYYKDYLILDVVRASLSIPVVFEPARLRTKVIDRAGQPHLHEQHGLFVDGGLVCNEALSTFDQKRYVDPASPGESEFPLFNKGTLAFCFEGEQASDETEPSTLGDYLQHLMAVFYNAEAVIAEYSNRNYGRSIMLNTGDISTLSFKALTPKQLKQLEKEAFNKVFDYFGLERPLFVVQADSAEPLARLLDRPGGDSPLSSLPSSEREVESPENKVWSEGKACKIM